jgi:putative transposase
MAKENANYGYLRIRGERMKVAHTVARTTVTRTRQNNGIAPSPDRPTSWRTLLNSHADIIVAAEVFTVDLCTKHGLHTHYAFAVIHHATRMVEIADFTPNPDGNFMAQVARSQIDHVDGFLRDKNYLILDNDTAVDQTVRTHS